MWNATVPSDAERIAALRHAAERHLQACDTHVDVDVVILMISELVTNALRHGDPPATISVNTDPDRVRVAVCDHSLDLPRVLPMEPTRVGGNGMRIIETLSNTWGYDPVEGGKSVWFEVLAS